MPRHGPLKKPSMAHMPVLLFLADHPELLLVSSSVLHHTSYHFAYENGSRYRDKSDWSPTWGAKKDAPKPDWYYNDVAPEINRNLATHRWMQSGWLVHVPRKSKEDDKDNPDNHWSWYDHPYRMTDAGREMAEKHRAAYEEHLAKKLEEQKQTERYVVVRTQGLHRHESRKYGILAKVLRETDKRLYVEVIERSSRIYDPTVHGRPGHEYVERDDVTADGVTPAEFHAMKRVETAHMAWMADIRAQEEAEIKEIQDRYKQRREQNQFAFEDELREALEQVKKDAQTNTN